MEEKSLEENLVKAFINKNADKIYDKMNKKGSFNIYAGLFGIYYFLYRKMFLYSFIIFLIQIVVANLLNALKVSDFFSILVTFVISGFLFYPLYKMHIKNKIEKIMAKTQNQEESANLS